MSIKRVFGSLTIAALATCFSSEKVCGQVTFKTVQTSAPAVVGYTARPAGLFGFRTAFQPIVANVPVQKTVAVQQAPVFVAPPVSVQPSFLPAPVTVQRPFVPAPVAFPANNFLAPVPPTPMPVTNFFTPFYSF